MNQIEKLKLWIESNEKDLYDFGGSPIGAIRTSALLDYLYSLPSAPEEAGKDEIDGFISFLMSEPDISEDSRLFCRGMVALYMARHTPPPTVPVGSTGREKCDCGMVVGYCQKPGFCPHLDIPIPTQFKEPGDAESPRLTENEDA